jgi:PAS domain-containing protein
LVIQEARSLTRESADRQRVEQELRASEEQWRLAAAAAKFGTYDVDLSSGAVSWSPEMRSLLGVDAGAPALPAWSPEKLLFAGMIIICFPRDILTFELASLSRFQGIDILSYTSVRR